MKLTSVGLPVILCLTSLNVAARCLELSDSTLEVEEMHGAMLTARWSAYIDNVCDAPYDGTLRVKFHVAGERVAHESVGFIVLQSGESDEVDGTINLPVNALKEIDRTEYEITERERPI